MQANGLYTGKSMVDRELESLLDYRVFAIDCHGFRGGVETNYGQVYMTWGPFSEGLSISVPKKYANYFTEPYSAKKEMMQALFFTDNPFSCKYDDFTIPLLNHSFTDGMDPEEVERVSIEYWGKLITICTTTGPLNDDDLREQYENLLSDESPLCTEAKSLLREKRAILDRLLPCEYLETSLMIYRLAMLAENEIQFRVIDGKRYVLGKATRLPLHGRVMRCDQEYLCLLLDAWLLGGYVKSDEHGCNIIWPTRTDDGNEVELCEVPDEFRPLVVSVYSKTVLVLQKQLSRLQEEAELRYEMDLVTVGTYALEMHRDCGMSLSQATEIIQECFFFANFFGELEGTMLDRYQHLVESDTVPLAVRERMLCCRENVEMGRSFFSHEKFSCR